MKKLILISILLTFLLSGCSSFHEHKWTEANYQTPATCNICGKTKGVKLEPDFEKKQMSTNMELNTEYDYKTVCSEDTNFETIGKAIIVSDEIIDADETHPAKEGYQYRIVTLNLTFNDYNSNEYGFKYNYFTTDYYDIDGFTESYYYDSENQLNHFTVNMYGQDYDCTLHTSLTKSDWKKNREGLYEKTLTFTHEFLLPTDYDGIVIGLRDSSIDATNVQFIYQYFNEEQFLSYRLEKLNVHE